MKAFVLLSMLSIACTGMMGCEWDHDEHHHHDEHTVVRHEDHVIVVPEHQEEVRDVHVDHY